MVCVDIFEKSKNTYFYHKNKKIHLNSSFWSAHKNSNITKIYWLFMKQFSPALLFFIVIQQQSATHGESKKNRRIRTHKKRRKKTKRRSQHEKCVCVIGISVTIGNVSINVSLVEFFVLLSFINSIERQLHMYYFFL